METQRVRWAATLGWSDREGMAHRAESHRASRILVVDDDEVIRSCIISTLAEEGYHAVGAVHGKAALDYLESLHRSGQPQPQLILLDMRMPVMDGWAFARAYRELPVTHAPIVIVTAAADAVERAAQIQADGVIPKPFDLDHLLTTVGEYARVTA